MPKKRKKMTPMKYPIHIEAIYRRQLRWMNNEQRKSIKHHIVPIIPSITKEASNIHALPTGEVTQGSYRHDAWQDELYDAFQKIAEDMVGPQQHVTKQMISYGAKINEHNKDEWKKLIRSQYGVNPTREDPSTYLPLMRNWAKDNAALIKDIPEKAMRQIADLTRDTLLSGKSQQDMTDELYDILDERMDVTDSRVNLIARDQVAKLNGRLTRERQTDVGVESYIWRTVGDERVRDEHDMVDGQTFQWGSPPGETDGNEPGEDYQCRCWAEPVLPESLDVSASLLEEEMEDA